MSILKQIRNAAIATHRGAIDLSYLATRSKVAYLPALPFSAYFVALCWALDPDELEIMARGRQE